MLGAADVVQVLTPDVHKWGAPDVVQMLGAAEVLQILGAADVI